MIWAVWISALLFVSITEGLSNFPENFVLARKDEDSVLTCNTNAGRAVTWKFNNYDLEDVMFEGNLTENGQRLTVSKVDPQMGEYSCWSEEQMLSSVYLLLEAKESDSMFHCWAKSYDCSFNCNWASSAYAAVRVGLGPECTKGLKTCQWVNSSLPLRGGGFVFHLSHSLSPYAEEKTMLEVTAEAILDRSIFSLIAPRSLSVKKMGQKMKVTIEPPPTWSSPHSFFSLEHQIEYVLKDDGKIEHTSSALIPLMISRLRVRSRDSLVLSNWSHWSDWKNESEFL